MKTFLHDVPNVLYKYRDWGNAYHKKLLLNGELYFASVDQFNDPFDGTIPHRYNPIELTEDNIFLKYREMAKREHPDWDETSIHEECFEYHRRGYFRDEAYLERFEESALQDLKKQFGIVCLCRQPDNFLLWSHYANSHTGFCVGFDKFNLFKDAECQFAHMVYQEEFPLLGLFDNVHDHFRRLIGTKSLTWKYEEEYRLTKAEAARKTVHLRPETIVEVVIGCQMPFKERENIVNFVTENLPHVKGFEMVKSKNAFQINRQQIF